MSIWIGYKGIVGSLPTFWLSAVERLHCFGIDAVKLRSFQQCSGLAPVNLSTKGIRRKRQTTGSVVVAYPDGPRTHSTTGNTGETPVGRMACCRLG